MSKKWAESDEVEASCATKESAVEPPDSGDDVSGQKKEAMKTVGMRSIRWWSWCKTVGESFRVIVSSFGTVSHQPTEGKSGNNREVKNTRIAHSVYEERNSSHQRHWWESGNIYWQRAVHWPKHQDRKWVMCNETSSAVPEVRRFSLSSWSVTTLNRSYCKNSFAFHLVLYFALFCYFDSVRWTDSTWQIVSEYSSTNRKSWTSTHVINKSAEEEIHELCPNFLLAPNDYPIW